MTSCRFTALGATLLLATSATTLGCSGSDEALAEPQESSEGQALTSVPPQEVATAELEKTMIVAGPSSGYPEHLQGIFWLDGVPVPDTALSLANAPIHPTTRVSDVDVTGSNIWAFNANRDGRFLYDFCRAIDLHYDVHWNRDFQNATIRPVVRLLGVRIEVPENLMKFTVTHQGNGVLLRETTMFGGEPQRYNMRQIIDGQGQHVPAHWVDFAARGPKAVYLFAKDRT